MRYHAIGFGFLNGWTSTALTGQTISQLKHVQQSCGYLMTAFSPGAFTSMTSPGQTIAQAPQPMHTSFSIFLIIFSPLLELSFRSLATNALAFSRYLRKPIRRELLNVYAITTRFPCIF